MGRGTRRHRGSRSSRCSCEDPGPPGTGPRARAGDTRPVARSGPTQGVRPRAPSIWGRADTGDGDGLTGWKDVAPPFATRFSPNTFHPGLLLNKSSWKPKCYRQISLKGATIGQREYTGWSGGGPPSPAPDPCVSCRRSHAAMAPSTQHPWRRLLAPVLLLPLCPILQLPLLGLLKHVAPAWGAASRLALLQDSSAVDRQRALRITGLTARHG